VSAITSVRTRGLDIKAGVKRNTADRAARAEGEPLIQRAGAWAAALVESGFGADAKADRAVRPAAGSSIFLVLYLAADNLADIRVLALIDQGGIHRLVVARCLAAVLLALRSNASTRDVAVKGLCA
jgi:hypothetical protein